MEIGQRKIEWNLGTLREMEKKVAIGKRIGGGGVRKIRE